METSKTVTRRVSYSEGRAPSWLKSLGKFLFSRYGQPEGYGICFNMGRETWGSTYRCNDRNRMVSFDSSKNSAGVTETLVTIRVMGGAL